MNDFSNPLNPINPGSPLHPNNMDYRPIYKEEPDNNAGIPIIIGFLFMLFLALIIRKK